MANMLSGYATREGDDAGRGRPAFRAAPEGLAPCAPKGGVLGWLRRPWVSQALQPARSPAGPEPSQSSDEQACLRAGDAARDGGDWAAAEQAYRAFLDKAPEQAAIWVQYGHALKEQGKLDAAEAAYRKALSLEPDEADTWLQLGHALKLRGRVRHARDAYMRSFRLAPTNAAREELGRLDEADSAEGSSGPLRESPAVSNLVYFEIDDLLGYLRRHTTLSGIQRVQVNVTKHLLSLIRSSPDFGYAIVHYRAEEGVFQQLDLEAAWALIEYCSGDRLERDRLNALLHQLEQSGAPAHLSAGQCYFIFSGFWTYRIMDRYLKVRAAGLTIGVFLYDLIPLTHPEFCDAGLVSDFTLSLGDGFALFDFVLTISEFSARELRRYITEHDLRPLPVEAVSLAHVVKDPSGPRRSGEWTDRLAPLRQRPFVLSVATIEARKNHAYIVACWKLLQQEGIEVPDLVFVGRHGMRVNDLMEQLRATQYMNDRVHVMHDLADAEMEMLYQNCLFTAFPSFIEGWGLPVGESLAHAVPCVASSTSAIPEVGGDLVDYVDPYNVRDGVEAFRRMILDVPYRTQRRASILASFQARTWEDVATDLLRHVAQFRSASVPGTAAPLLHAGEVFKVGDLHIDRPVPPNYPSRPLRLILAEGWYPVDVFGAWMRGKEAVLRFATPHDAGAEIVLYLQFTGASRMDGVSLTVSASGGDAELRCGQEFPASALPRRVTLAVRSSARFTTRLLGRVSGQGVVEAKLAVRGDVPPISDSDQTRLSVGIVALGYALRSDAAKRADLTDAFAPEWLS